MPVAAIIAKEGTVEPENIVKMLEAMRYNKDRFAIATNGEVARTKDPCSLSLSPRKIAIGCSGSSLSNAEFMSSNLNNELSLVLEGYALDRSLGKEIGSSSELILDLIDQRMRNSDDLGVAVKSILPVLRGAYSFAVTGGNKIVVARDVFGFEPLYWGENESYIAFASARKALWRLGINPISFLPGHVLTTDGRNRDLSEISCLVKPHIVDVDLDSAARLLAEKLRNVFLWNYRGIKKAGVLFSGGVDSSLVARVLTDVGVRVTLYGVAAEGAYDVSVIEKAASKLELEFCLRKLSLEDVEDYLHKTLYAVEEASILNAGIGLTLYAAMETASRNGVRNVFSGQGADELFGGYSRYRRVADNTTSLNDAMWNDVVNISAANLERDGAIAMVNNVNSHLPFLDLDFVSLAMSFPVNLKVRGEGDELRKHVLRAAAKILGLPEAIAYASKKAVQYSSGSEKAIRKLATRRNERPNEYLKKIFDQVFREYFLTGT